MNPQSVSLPLLSYTSASPRNGQLLPIGAILPDVLRRYDLLPAVSGRADRYRSGHSSPSLEPGRTTSLASVDGIPYY